jgi:XTP/dITP diphosphohydrolase
LWFLVRVDRSKNNNLKGEMSTVELMLATGNVHKVAEIRRMLPDCYEISCLSDVGFTDEIPETADSFAGNALLKAQFVYEKFKCNVIADDSGLEVEALNGEPGVKSARYAEVGSTSFDNVQKLLSVMNGVENRKSRFVTVICLIFNGKESYFEGFVDGYIAHSPVGTNGFGYDPVFIPDGFTQTFAQLSPDIKDQLSHRGKAILKLKEFLEHV